MPRDATAAFKLDNLVSTIRKAGVSFEEVEEFVRARRSSDGMPHRHRRDAHLAVGLSRLVEWEARRLLEASPAARAKLDELGVDDPINPAHYKQHPSGVECIEITEHYGFCVGNAIKYLWRAGLKSNADELEDLRKAEWYVEREIALRESRREAAENPSSIGPGKRYADVLEWEYAHTPCGVCGCMFDEHPVRNAEQQLTCEEWEAPGEKPDARLPEDEGL